MEDLPRYFELCVIHAWLKGKTRDEIAEEFGKSQGTVSNIIAKMRNSLGRYDADAMREMAQELRELDMTPENCAIGCRISKVLEKLKIPEGRIAEFLNEIFEFSQKMDINTGILRDAIIEFIKISKEVPFSQVPSYLEEKREEIEQLENKKKKLEEEIQILQKEKLATEEKVRSSMKDANLTSFNLDNFVNTKNNLSRYNILVEDIDKFTKCVQGIKNYSNYDPFKVIEKFSDLNMLEMEIENNQKIKNNLEINIKKLKEKETEYDDRLNFKYIKVKNLDELEKTGFSIQDLKKLKSILIEISSEHKNFNIEQVKRLFFELLEKIETRITLESENNGLLQVTGLLQNQIKDKRHILYNQELVGPILKNLFDVGIRESEIIAIKALIDILLYASGNNMEKLNEKQEVINDLSSYSNLKLAKENLKREINTILNTENLEKIQNHINRLNKSSTTINNSENLNGRKQVVLCDSII
jgi:transcriptional regulator with XRE-family HTH domain